MKNSVLKSSAECPRCKATDKWSATYHAMARHRLNADGSFGELIGTYAADNGHDAMTYGCECGYRTISDPWVDEEAL